MQDFAALFRSFREMKVAVIGDVMLDSYMWGRVDRISPEAPVPVVALHRKEHRIGGAGNVALNAHALGASLSVFSVLGQDEGADRLTELFQHHGIRTGGLVRSARRRTTSKTRIISRNQQMMRVDDEMTEPLEPADADALITSIGDYISAERPDILIFEDYNKGVLSAPVISAVLEHCRRSSVLTAVDPKRMHFFDYAGVDLFKPNLKEVREALNLMGDGVSLTSLQAIHQELIAKLHHRISFITLSEKGVFYQMGNQSAMIPSHLRHIADVSGAGDTVIAVAALVYAATQNVHLMAEVANIAGGLVCETVGTTSVSAERLLQECELLLS
ncbi:MAG: hypothetical protein RJA57_313 [Bacteroidota bacterium]|jgi:rfaE bifunctional protein kinase chain/domain